MTMMQFFNQLVQFVQQGISAVFRFVQVIWTWSVGQITQVIQSPWQSWPLWKQIFLLLVIAGVVWALYKAGKELFKAGERALGAFATLLGVFVRTLPRAMLAGLIAMGGAWFLNHFDPSSIRIPTSFKTTSK
jgi:hypothetical protein